MRISDWGSVVGSSDLTAPGNATALLGVMDKGLWRVGAEGNDGWSYSPLPGRSVNRSAVAHLRSIDKAADDPAFVVGLFQQDGSNGWSEDWGRTFTALEIGRAHV